MIDGPKLDGNSGRRQPVELSLFPSILYHVGPMRRPCPWASEHADGRPFSMTSLALRLACSLIGIDIAVGPRLAPNSGWRRPVEPRLVAMWVKLGPAFYVFSGRQLDAYWANSPDSRLASEILLTSLRGRFRCHIGTAVVSELGGLPESEPNSARRYSDPCADGLLAIPYISRVVSNVGHSSEAVEM